MIRIGLLIKTNCWHIVQNEWIQVETEKYYVVIKKAYLFWMSNFVLVSFISIFISSCCCPCENQLYAYTWCNLCWTSDHVKKHTFINNKRSSLYMLSYEPGVQIYTYIRYNFIDFIRQFCIYINEYLNKKTL